MSEKFSPTVRLGDLNDFISPSQACVVSLKGSKKSIDKKPDRQDVVVSISPQSRTSLAVHYDISPLQVFKKLTTFLKSLGVKAVFDTSCSRDLVLIEACNEFVSRYKQASSEDGENLQSPLPVISSACPGWICYAEKQLGSFVLPYVSSVKSPQQTIGAAIKHHAGGDLSCDCDALL